MFPKSEIDRRYRVYLKTRSMRKTAAVFGVSTQAIHDLFKTHGMPTLKDRQYETPIQDKIRERVIKLHRQGFTRKEIGIRLKVSDATLAVIYDKVGMKAVGGRRPKLPKECERTMVHLYKNYKFSMHTLGKFFGLTQPAVHRYLKRNKVKVRKRGQKLWKK